MNNINQQPAPQVKIKPSAGGLYGWSIKKHLGIAAIFTFLMFLAMPVVNLLSIIQNYITGLEADYLFDIFLPEEMQSIFYLSEVFLIPTCIIFSIVLSCMLFNYMHSKVAVDTFHALPVKRSTIFLSKYFAGITLLNVPVILMVAITIIIHSVAVGMFAPQNFDFETIKIMLKFLLMFILTQTAFFTMTAFVSVNTGTIFDMVLSLFSINAAWPLLFVLFNSLFSSNLYGYTSIIDYEVYFLFSPLARMITSSFEFDIFPIIWWIVFTVGLLFASVFMYNRRKSEVTGKSFAFKPMKFALLIIVPLISGMVLGLIFQIFVNSNIIYFIGFILGSFAAHVIVQIIIARGFKGFAKSLIIYGSTVVGFAVFFIIICTGLFGYETRLPNAEKVEGAYIAVSSDFHEDYVSSYLNVPIYDDIIMGSTVDMDTINNDPDMFLQSDESLQTVHSLHECIVKSIPLSKQVKSNLSSSLSFIYNANTIFTEDPNEEEYDDFNDDYNYGYVTITYNLKNGTAMTRSYILSVNQFDDYIEQLESNLEYNQKYNYAFNRPDTVSNEYVDSEYSEHYKATGEPSYEGWIDYYSADGIAMQKKLNELMDNGLDYYYGDSSYFDSSYINEWGEKVFVKDGVEYFYDAEFDEYYLNYSMASSPSNYITHEQAVALMDAYQADLTNELSGTIDQSEPLGKIQFSTGTDVYFNLSIAIKPSYENILNLDFVQQIMTDAAFEELESDTTI